VTRLDWGFPAAILLTASVLRLWAPWDDVMGGSRVNVLETDAWYQARLVENQVRNFPHRVTVDPYASLNGQYVAVAPLPDLAISTVVVATQGRDASTAYIERVAALAPAVAAVWLLGTIAFDRRAGLMAGLLAAVLPGHFLDRTLVGFVDHHARRLRSRTNRRWCEYSRSFSSLNHDAHDATSQSSVCVILGFFVVTRLLPATDRPAFVSASADNG
jgi:asparagine N-glycosylation enzyme membrane subunit Stt3